MNIFLKTIYFLLFAGFFFSHLPPVYAAKPLPVVQQNYSVVAGEWQRTDGSYVVKISNIKADGQVDVKYFNPRPIHVEQAAITTQKKLIKIFIHLQDKGYEGSTYTLYYYAEKDAMVGFYYQAVVDKTFEVIFLRINS